jgi:GTP cyclohydrolase II
MQLIYPMNQNHENSQVKIHMEEKMEDLLQKRINKTDRASSNTATRRILR